MNYLIPYEIEYKAYLENKTENTMKYYIYEISYFFTWLDRNYNNLEIYSITLQIIKEYLKHEQDNKKAIKTINKKIAVIRSYFDFLWRKGEIGIDPAAKIKPLSISQIEAKFYLDEKDIHTVYSYLENYALSKNTKNFLRDLALFSLFYYAGLKISEVYLMKKDSFAFTDEALYISINSNRSRIVEISNQESIYIRNYLKLVEQNNSEYVFLSKHNKPLTSRAIQLIFKNVSNILDIELTPQKLRNTFGVNKIKNGYSAEEVSEILGIDWFHNYKLMIV